MQKTAWIVLMSTILLIAGVYFFSTRQQTVSSELESNTSVQPSPTASDSATMNAVMTIEEIAQHNTESDCYVVVDGLVYNVTDFIPQHPGGPEKIINACGTDATNIFMAADHPETAKARLAQYQVGEI